MDLNPIRDGCNHVSKKQKICETKTEETVSKVSQEIDLAVKKLSGSSEGEGNQIRQVLAELQATLCEIGPLGQVASSHKDLNVALTKYGKALDKFFLTDIAKAQREVNFDLHIINKMIAVHFYRLEQFELGDYFMQEAEEIDPALKVPFEELFSILEQIQLKNLGPALEWAKLHHDELNKKGSSLELNLHQLQFIHLLQQGMRPEALKYAKENFGSFASSQMTKIQRLMGCLLWSDRLENSPYRDLSDSTNWNTVSIEFTRECCNLNGYPYQTALRITISAGTQALPTLLKMANVLSSKKQEWLTLKQLPMEVELDKEYQFHSIFSCPVSKEQSTPENPPMLMPCGHVLCRQSLQKLSKNRAFKCPYCPTELVLSQCKPIFF